MITNEISEKYLRQMLTGYIRNLPKIEEHIEQLKTQLIAAEKSKSEMQSAISDINSIFSETV